MTIDYLVVGRITKPHGVRGEVRVLPYTESVSSFTEFAWVYIKPRAWPEGNPEPGQRLIVEEARPHKNLVLMKLKGISSRDRAQALAGTEIMVEKSRLPAPREDEYFWADLIGMEVRDDSDRLWGRVTNLLSTGEDDQLVVRRHGREVLVPFRTEIVTDVDLEQNCIRIWPLEGLDDL